MAITIKSVNQILSDMVRRVLSETNLTNVRPGSVLATMLEAASVADFQNSLSVLKILESTNLETLSGVDLDAKATEMTLPNGIGGYGRQPARRTSGTVTIGSGFTKASSSIYPSKPAPFPGALSIFVQSTTGFPPSGKLYIGRFTNNEEGPLRYQAIYSTSSYYEIMLDPTTPVLKDHRYDEQVVVAQGGVRNIPAGTLVSAPATNAVPAVNFITETAVRLLDGESDVDATVICTEFGESGNVTAGAIQTFSNPPFSGATVSNAVAFSNGSSAESDEKLRQRIRDHYASLSRGTKTAIMSSLYGLRDPETGKTITSANLNEPLYSGDTAKIYVDDGTGFEPAIEGQPFETLLASSNGQETLFRTARTPVSPAVVTGTEVGPFQLTAGQTLTVTLDGVIETFTVLTSDFVNLVSVPVSELVNVFNQYATSVGFRTANGGKNIAVFDLTGRGERLVVSSGSLQTTLGLSTVETRPVFLYKNSELLSFRGSTATLTTQPYPWTDLTGPDMQNCVISVDGVVQTFTVADIDFNSYGTSIATATLPQWAEVLMKKVAGLQVTTSVSSTGSGVLVFKTWQVLSAGGSVEIVSGGWKTGSNKMWPDGVELKSSGFSADFDFNRVSGQIRLLSRPSVGDKLTLGSDSTRAAAYSKSAANGIFGLGSSSIGNPRILVGVDGDFEFRSMIYPVDAAYTASAVNGYTHLIRLDANSNLFTDSIQVNDIVYMTSDTDLGATIPASANGFYRVKEAGSSYIVLSASPSQLADLSGLTFSVGFSNFFVFKCEGATPQVIDFSSSSLMSVDDLVTTINNQLIGGRATKISPKRFKIETLNLDKDYGRLAVFGVLGNAQNVFEAVLSESTQSHTAYKHTNEIPYGCPKFTGFSGPTMPADFYARRGFMSFSPINTDITGFTGNNTNIQASVTQTTYPVGLQELFVTGPNSGKIVRVYNNNTVIPYDGFATGTKVAKPVLQTVDSTTLSRFDGTSIRMEDLPLSFVDRLVVMMDGDQNSGISSVPMYKRAMISSMFDLPGADYGTQIFFTLKDPDEIDPLTSDFREFFSDTSVFKNFDFTDFNVLFKSYAIVNLYGEDPVTKLPDYTSVSPIIVYSTQMGPVNRIAMNIVYPTEASKSEPAISLKNYIENGDVITRCVVVLPSGPQITSYASAYMITPAPYTNLDTGSEIVEFTIKDAVGGAINSSGLFKTGDILVIGGTHPLYSGAFLITAASASTITVAAPGVRSAVYPVDVVMSHLSNPLFSMERAKFSYNDFINAVDNSFMSENDVLTILSMNPVGQPDVIWPTYLTQGRSTELYTDSIGDALDYHSIVGTRGGIAHIHTYDPVAGMIIAVLQSTETPLPSSLETFGSSYTYRNEMVTLVPANQRALNNWLNFTASSSLSGKSSILPVMDNKKIQIESNSNGTSGSVSVLGLSANSMISLLNTLPTEDNEGFVRTTINFVDAQSIPRGALLSLSNSVPTKITRAYSTSPQTAPGYSVVTTSNNSKIDDFFRNDTTASYSRPAVGVARFTFKRSSSGFDLSQTAVNTISITRVGSGPIFKIEATGTNELRAKVGDMMVIKSTAVEFDPANRCTPISGEVLDAYVGYPVVHVGGLKTIYVIAPNMVTTSVDVGLLGDNVVFLPSVSNEKNIKSNYGAGAKYYVQESDFDKQYLMYRIKNLGRGLQYLEVSTSDSTGEPSTTELDMLLSGLSVNTDDFIQLSEAFAPKNRGKFRIIAHNGKNAFIFFNPNGGVDEIVRNDALWGSGPIGDSTVPSLADYRHIRVWDTHSVFPGDKLVIAASSTSSSDWFPAAMLGSWSINKIGVDSDYQTFVEVSMPSAPTSNPDVVLGLNTSAIYFMESEFGTGETSRLFGHKWFAGYSPSATNYIDDADCFLFPANSIEKMTLSNGTILSAVHKIGLVEDISTGLDGYSFFRGLIAESHRVVDGSSTNPIDYPGSRAVGSIIEILPPLIKSIRLSLQIVPVEGSDLNSLKPPVRSTVMSYINGLGVGQSVILSEVTKRIQQVPGVRSVVIASTVPVSDLGIIGIGSREIARVTSSTNVEI